MPLPDILRQSCLVSAVFLLSCTSDPADNSIECESAFVALARSGEMSSVNGLAVSPNYRSFVITEMSNGTAILAVRHCVNGEWAESQPLYAASNFHDYQPTFSQDGERLYFTSTRPISGEEPARQNVWVASQEMDYQNPEIIKELISPGWDGHAVELQPGSLLFATERNGEDRLIDIFHAKLDAGDVQLSPVPALNSTMSDNDMAFNYQLNILVFSRYDPATEDINLYYSKFANNTWLQAEQITGLSTEEWELSPAFTPDGEYFLFIRGGVFQIIPMSELSDMFSQ